MILNSPYISGSLTVTGNITACGGVTISGSIASASYAANTTFLNGLGSEQFVPTGSFNTFSSSILTYTGSVNSRLGSIETVTGSNITRLGALEVASGSAITRLNSIETVTGSNITRLSSLEARTGSFATTGSNTFIGNQVVSGSIVQSGSFTTTGTIIAQTINVQTVTSSIVYSSGSNIFGNLLGDSQTFTGSVLVTGSLTIAGASSATSYSGTTIYGSTAVCSPVGKFTSCIDAGSGNFNGNLNLTSSNSAAAIITSTGTNVYSSVSLTNITTGYGYDIGFGGSTSIAPNSFYIYGGATASIKLAITCGGNVGIGVTPSLWANGTENSLQIKNASIYEYGAYEMGLQVNAFYNTSVAPSGWKYISTGVQCIGQLQLSGGDLNYNVANPGTAGCAITWNTKFNITRTGCVGIGTATPGYRLEICGDGTGIGELAVKGTGTDIGLALNNTGTGGKAWRILSTGGGSGAGNGKLITWDGTGYGWVMDCSRNMGIGTTTVDSYPNYTTLQVGCTNGIIQTYDGTVKTAIVSNSQGAGLMGTRTNHDLRIVANDTERIRIMSTGIACFSCQICAPAGVKFANGASTLNYYEEGGWYPQMYWSAGGIYNMSGINCGRYTRVGNIVDLQFQLDWSSYNGGASGGTLRVGPVPFTNNGGSRAAGSVTAISLNSMALSAGYTWLGLTIDPGANFIYLIQNASAGGYSHVPQVGASGIVYSLSISYSV